MERIEPVNHARPERNSSSWRPPTNFRAASTSSARKREELLLAIRKPWPPAQEAFLEAFQALDGHFRGDLRRPF